MPQYVKGSFYSIFCREASTVFENPTYEYINAVQRFVDAGDKFLDLDVPIVAIQH